MSDKVVISPQFVSAALAGITHRFVLILECETRHYGDPNKQNKYVPPRFSVGGPRANLDPRSVPVRQLLDISVHKNEIQIPGGWEKVHQYVYIKHANTDDHGWQYRTDWSEGALQPTDEQWVGVNTDGKDVRRRLWMTTVVRREDLIRSKKILSEVLHTSKKGVILQGELFKLEQGALKKSWQRRTVRLLHETIEFYNGNEKKGEIPISGCEVKMLFGSQCPGRDFAFSIRNPNGNVAVWFDADSKELRRKWVVAVGYQIALNWPDCNFPPFEYGPLTGEEAVNRVLICGELQKRGHVVKNWKVRFFQLIPRELQYFEKETLKGKINIEDAQVEYDDRSLDFTVRAVSGAVLIMRADSANTKNTWVRTLLRQIQALKDSKVSTPVLTADEIEDSKKSDARKAAAAPASAPAAAAAAPAAAPAPAPVPEKEEVVAVAVAVETQAAAEPTPAETETETVAPATTESATSEWEAEEPAAPAAAEPESSWASDEVGEIQPEKTAAAPAVDVTVSQTTEVAAALEAEAEPVSEPEPTPEPEPEPASQPVSEPEPVHSAVAEPEPIAATPEPVVVAPEPVAAEPAPTSTPAPAPAPAPVAAPVARPAAATTAAAATAASVAKTEASFAKVSLKPKPASAPAPASTGDIIEEDDEDEALFDPYLQFGGAYAGDSKDTESFKFIKFSEYPKLLEHKNLMAKFISKELFYKLKDVATPSGYSFSNAIMTGVVNPTSVVGVTAGDFESYEAFQDLFNPILRIWHGCDPNATEQLFDTDVSRLTIPAVQQALFDQHISSITVNVYRNITGFPLLAGISESDRAQVEQIIKEAASSLSGEFTGNYRELASLSEDEKEKYVSAGLLFEIPGITSRLTGAGVARSWPNNRGFFLTNNESAALWVNEEDHLRFVLKNTDGSDLLTVFARTAKLVHQVEAALEARNQPVLKSSRLGYVTTCPSNVGTAWRTTIVISLPSINTLMQTKKYLGCELLARVCNAFDMQYLHGQGLEPGKFRVSNKPTLGQSEAQLAQKLIDGISKLIEVEVLLASGTPTEEVVKFINSSCKPAAEKATFTSPTAKRASVNYSAAPSIIPKTDSDRVILSPALLKPVQRSDSAANPAAAAPVAAVDTPAATPSKPDPVDDFGTVAPESPLDPTIEARMNKKLLEASRDRRSSFVLKQVAKHEAFFEQQGIDKNTPTLANKQGYKKFP